MPKKTVTVSYVTRHKIEGNRTVAIFVVAAVHVALGYALVTGLAYSVIQKAAEDLKAFNIEEEPPPPELPPPPPQEQVPETAPPIVAPPPIVRTVSQPPPVRTVTAAPPPVVTYRAPIAPPAPPAPARPPPPPPPVKVTPPKSAVGNLQGLFRTEDYPQSAIEQDEQGLVTVRLTVGTNGRVTDCAVVRSSGHRVLDRTTCRILSSRAKFEPARDNRGNPTTDTVRQQIRWVLEG